MRGRKALCHKGVCVGIVETIVGSLLCCGVDIVQCFQSFVLHHLVIHSSATPTKQPQKENFAGRSREIISTIIPFHKLQKYGACISVNFT